MPLTIIILSVLVLALFIIVPGLIRKDGSGKQPKRDLPDGWTAEKDTIAVVAPPPVVTVPSQTPSPMADYSIAYEIVKGHEAGYQRNPNDRGNYNSNGELVGTNWGINARVYENWIGRPPTISDMRNMPQERAKRIFKDLYWDKIRGDDIPDQQLANIFFDGVVNHGYGVWLMQDVLGVPRDNRFGPITFSALIRANPKSTFNKYKARRIRYYNSLVDNDASQGVFLRGWLRRINSFIYVGGAVAGGSMAIGALFVLAYFVTR